MSAVLATEEASHAGAPPSSFKDFLRHFASNKGALAGLIYFTLIVLAAVLAGVLAPHDPVEQFRDALLTPPAWAPEGSAKFLLGTDDIGRDILSRLLYGARLSLMIGLVSVVLAMIPGIALGLAAAFFPRVGIAILRLMDIMLALPSLLLAIAVVAVLGPGLTNTMFAIALVAIPNYVRLVRASAMSELTRDYVVASRLAGASTLRLMFDTVLPNCMAPVIVTATLGFSDAILTAAALGFLGLGAQPPTP
jgi:dipeptide transport system permease protein